MTWSNRELEAQLGADLATLVSALDAPVVEILPVTGLPARECGRATFRLQLADGRLLKGRRLDAAEDASRIAFVVGRLGLRELPRVFAQHGVALLEEWIDGEPLGPGDPESDFLVACGRILGSIHATATVAADRLLTGFPERPERPEVHCRRLECAVSELVHAGALSTAQARDIHDVAREHAPTRIAIGFVHRDFCGENVVRGPDGAPFVVDSGSVGIDAYDFDLARTWYRWPLGEASRRAFEEGYRTHRSPENFDSIERHRPFWALVVLTEAMTFRLTAGTDGWQVPLLRLESLLQNLRRADVRSL